jgi:hypothetical protein
MTITYSDGARATTADSQDDAIALIASRYSLDPADLVTEESDERTLVWLSESDAANDDGSSAVAEIRA